MKQVDWSKVKKNRITKCTKCASKIAYMNPFATCFKCKKRFCFDCIYSGMVNNKMKQNDEIRKLCDICKEKYNYIHL